MKRGLSFLWGWMVILCTIVFSVHCIALHKEFYTDRYESMHMDTSLSVSLEDLDSSIEILLAYIGGKTDSMELDIVRNGIQVEAFNAKEKAHMVDVRGLYQKAIFVGYVSLAGLLIVLLYFWIKDRSRMLAFLTRGFIRALICLIMALAFFGCWIAYDFTGFWNWFHTIFFSNNLWLLDPRTDFMICMLPEVIFEQLVISIAGVVLCVLVPLCIFSLWYQWKKAPIGFEDSV